MAAEAETEAEASAALRVALARFVGRRRVRRVYRAESGTTTPPPLAYFVHFPRLYVALSGRDAMWLERSGAAQRLALAAGDAVIVPANCWNRPDASARGTSLNVLFGRKQIGLSLVTQPPRGRPMVVKATLHGPGDDAVRSIMHALLTSHVGADGPARPLIEALLRAIVGSLTRPTPAASSRSATRHESICMYVQEHFQSPLTRDSVAAHFRISPAHVSRLFQIHGLVSFNRYVTYVRLNWAKYLLRHHQQTIDEIAGRCGFAETAYFCRVFKQRTDLTPSEYRSRRA